MRKVIAAILLLAFVGQTFSQGLYYLDYLVDKAKYEKRCVNKARPQMHCNGKCQVMKKIEEREKREQGLPPELKLAAKIEVLSSKTFFPLNPQVTYTSSRPIYFNHAIGYPVDQPSYFFHPPNV